MGPLLASKTNSSKVGKFIPSEGCVEDKSKTYCEEDEGYPAVGDITPNLNKEQLGNNETFHFVLNFHSSSSDVCSHTHSRIRALPQ